MRRFLTAFGMTSRHFERSEKPPKSVVRNRQKAQRETAKQNKETK